MKKTFFGDEVLLSTPEAVEIFREIRELPIIDYHCHLDETMIAENAAFSDIGELWLSGDHYKWRAMRLLGVPEEYITGNRSYKEKFMKYAEIMPALAGNPLYYWTHMELSDIMGIHLPLNRDTAEEIYRRANEKLKKLRVRDILSLYGVSYIATTDSPVSDLASHGIYGETTVAPTFRPDKLLAFDKNECAALAQKTGEDLETLDSFLSAIEKRLSYFVSKGCKIADHGFLAFPSVSYIGTSTAEGLYQKREYLSATEREALFGYLLVACTRLYKKYHILLQLHFAVTRNVNPEMHRTVGVDAGFDLPADPPRGEDVIAYLREIPDDERPETVLYTLNDTTLSTLCAITGAFRHVRIGPAWWFNDTLLGIKRNLATIGEYAALGTNFGMLTDSRSFASYARFGFFRRILSDHLGALVARGEYDMSAAKELARRISYENIKETLGL